MWIRAIALVLAAGVAASGAEAEPQPQPASDAAPAADAGAAADPAGKAPAKADAAPDAAAVADPAAAAAAAADLAAAQPPAAAPVVDFLLEQTADAHAVDGHLAMREVGRDATRNVDAALSFAQALEAYTQAGNHEAAREMQANIFWCRKRMDLDAIHDYLARKRSEAPAAMAAIDAVVDRQVDASEAQAWFDQAEAYALANPQRHLQVAIRWFEVAERFAGTPLAIRAQRSSLEHQQRAQVGAPGTPPVADAPPAERAAAAPPAVARRDSLFTRVPARGRAAVPTAAVQKAGQATVRDFYRDDYRGKDAQRRPFAEKLLQAARESAGDPGLRYVLLAETVRVAQAAEAYDLLLAAIDLQVESFAGIDGPAEKKAALGRLAGKPVAASLLALLDDPEDGGANAIAGRWFAASAGSWETALPLLARADDHDLSRLAELDLAAPATAPAQVEVADGWYEQARKARSPEKEAWLARARTWYDQAMPGLTGLTKARAAQRSLEIAAALPVEAVLDYAHLTPKQWQQLKGVIRVVQPRREPFDANYQIPAGQKVRVVPHPTDEWKIKTSARGMVASTWRGNGVAVAAGLPAGAMVAWVEGGAPQKPGLLSGPGRLLIGPVLPPGDLFDGNGMIRVKLVSGE